MEDPPADPGEALAPDDFLFRLPDPLASADGRELAAIRARRITESLRAFAAHGVPHLVEQPRLVDATVKEVVGVLLEHGDGPGPYGARQRVPLQLMVTAVAVHAVAIAGARPRASARASARSRGATATLAPTGRDMDASQADGRLVDLVRRAGGTLIDGVLGDEQLCPAMATAAACMAQREVLSPPPRAMDGRPTAEDMSPADGDTLRRTLGRGRPGAIVEEYDSEAAVVLAHVGPDGAGDASHKKKALLAQDRAASSWGKAVAAANTARELRARAQGFERARQAEKLATAHGARAQATGPLPSPPANSPASPTATQRPPARAGVSPGRPRLLTADGPGATDGPAGVQPEELERALRGWLTLGGGNRLPASSPRADGPRELSRRVIVAQKMLERVARLASAPATAETQPNRPHGPNGQQPPGPLRAPSPPSILLPGRLRAAQPRQSPGPLHATAKGREQSAFSASRVHQLSRRPAEAVFGGAVAGPGVATMSVASRTPRTPAERMVVAAARVSLRGGSARHGHRLPGPVVALRLVHRRAAPTPGGIRAGASQKT